MDTPPAANHYKNHRFPAEIISHAVWLYFRFSRGHVKGCVNSIRQRCPWYDGFCFSVIPPTIPAPLAGLWVFPNKRGRSFTEIWEALRKQALPAILCSRFFTRKSSQKMGYDFSLSSDNSSTFPKSYETLRTFVGKYPI